MTNRHDIGGSRAVERAFVLERLGCGTGRVLDLGSGPKPKLSAAALVRGFDVLALDLEPLMEGAMMHYTLAGDRRFEWGYVKEKLPQGQGALLDIGPAPGNPKPARIAVDRGWTVTAVGLEAPYRRMPAQRFTFVQGDFNAVDLDGYGPFDWILNVSTIEHFGLAGRYGITVQDDDADLRGMAKARRLLAPGGRMLLTVPVGQDAVFVPKHRVYGPARLPLLLRGYQAVEQRYYAKFDSDEYQECDRRDAYAQVPTAEPAYYALGCFELLGE